MDVLTEQERFWVFFVVWGICGFASWWFYTNATVSNKRKWHPWIVFGMGALFIGFTYFVFPNVSPLFLLAAALIVWWNYKRNTFCDTCGAMLIPTGWENKAPTCQACEAKSKVARGGKVEDMSQNRQVFGVTMAIFAGSILYQVIAPQGVVPFLPPPSSDVTPLLIGVAIIAFVVGILACRCPACGKFLTGTDGFTPYVPECPRCHVPFK